MALLLAWQWFPNHFFFTFTFFLLFISLPYYLNRQKKGISRPISCLTEIS